jgi:hypothetical protein
MRQNKPGRRSKAPSPRPTAAESEFAAKGLLSDLILHSFNVTNLIIKPPTFNGADSSRKRGRPKAAHHGARTGLVQLVSTGRACGSCAAHHRARLGYLFASSACFASPSPWDPLFEGVRAWRARLHMSRTPTPPRERRAPECPSFRRPHRPAPHALAPLAAAAARPSLLRAGLLSVSSLTRDGDLNCATELHYPLIKSPEFQNIFLRKSDRIANSSPALQKHGVSGLFFHRFAF